MVSCDVITTSLLICMHHMHQTHMRRSINIPHIAFSLYVSAYRYKVVPLSAYMQSAAYIYAICRYKWVIKNLVY